MVAHPPWLVLGTEVSGGALIRFPPAGLRRPRILRFGELATLAGLIDAGSLAFVGASRSSDRPEGRRCRRRSKQILPAVPHVRRIDYALKPAAPQKKSSMVLEMGEETYTRSRNGREGD